MRQLTQLFVGRLGVLESLRDERSAVFVMLIQRAECELERDDGVDEALLCTVVQIAHHAAPRLIAGR